MTGPNQRTPKDFNGALQSKKFKSALLSFLAKEWSQDSTLYVSSNKECFVYTTHYEIGSRSNVVILRNEHEEADTCIVLHIMHVTELNPQAVVVVHCNDTDVFCILCHHMKRIPVHVYMDTGYDNNNTRKYIDV